MEKKGKNRTITLPSGRIVPALGLGMWYLGEDAGAYFKETALIRQALEIGYRVFDTAEMYGNGGAEEVLGEAVADCRKEVFLTSKVSPESMTYEKIIEACDKSLERLQTDYLDMYLLHWNFSGKIYTEEILEAFTDLKNERKILSFGVSHFDLSELKEWFSFKEASQTEMNQAYFNLLHRQMEQELLPFCHKKKIPLIAYAPMDVYPSVYENRVLQRIADNNNATAQQIALAWLFEKENVGVLVKSKTQETLKSYFEAQYIDLSKEEMDALNVTFPLH